MTAQRIVLDTNIWLDWLVFDDLSLLKLKKTVSEGQAEIFIDAARADVLVTKDHKLLELARRAKAFRILNPRAF